MAKETSHVQASLKRMFYICVGLVVLTIGLIGRIPYGSDLPLWRRALGIVGGLFFIYIGSMYYFPKYRKKRAELDRILDEAEEFDRSHSK
jgi:hypothetical protein